MSLDVVSYSARPFRIRRNRTRLTVRSRPTYASFEYEKSPRPRDRGLSSTHLVRSSAKSCPDAELTVCLPKAVKGFVQDVVVCSSARRPPRPVAAARRYVRSSQLTLHGRPRSTRLTSRTVWLQATRLAVSCRDAAAVVRRIHVYLGLAGIVFCVAVIAFGYAGASTNHFTELLSDMSQTRRPSAALAVVAGVAGGLMILLALSFGTSHLGLAMYGFGSLLVLVAIAAGGMLPIKRLWTNEFWRLPAPQTLTSNGVHALARTMGA
jgi:hypothetical protein